MNVDIDRNAIESGEITIRCRHRLPRFIALLEAKRQLGLGPANMGEVMLALNPGGRSPRVLAARITNYAENTFEKLGILNPIVSTGRSSGNWHLNASFSPIDVIVQGQVIEPQAVLEFLGLYRAASSKQFDVATDLPSLRKLIEGDKFFASGSLRKALEAYLLVYKQANSPLTRSIALTRAVPTLRRLEDFAAMQTWAKKLQSEALHLADAEIAAYCNVTAQISLAWYDYSFDSRYDLAWDKISNLGPSCRRFTSLYVDWLNLRGLILRRQALGASGDERLTFVSQSLAELKAPFVDSILLNQPYQIQQTSSNLANIISLFIEKGDLITFDEAFSLVESASLMSISESVRKKFQIGNDDIYNPIYILSLFRRHSENRQQLTEAFSDIVGNQFISEYGDLMFESVSGSVEVGSTQQLQLSFEICHAAILEDRLLVFNKYFAKICDLMDSMPEDLAIPSWAANGSQIIRNQARNLRGNDKKWREAINLISYSEW